MDVFEQLREILDAHPSTAPSSPAIAEILRILFSKEEVQLAVHMSFASMGPAQIAQAAGVPAERACELLENMADRGVIISKDRKDGGVVYALLPTIPGLFEFPFMKQHPPQEERLAALWRQYHAEGMGAAFAGQPTPLMRVVPVNKALDFKNQVHPYEEAADLIRRTDYQAVARCACRASVQACDAPLDVCLIFDKPARFLVQRGFARALNVDEAIVVLDRAEKAGLVHTSNNSADRATVICNCCPCCCTVLRGRTELGLRDAFSASRFIPVVDNESCTGCGVCAEERCPMGAIHLENDIAVVESSSCIGCGLCVSGCPENAMRLEPRPDPPALPETVMEMGLKVAADKGRLERFMNIMARPSNTDPKSGRG